MTGSGHRMLIKGGRVLTMDPPPGDRGRADILIENGLIRDVAPAIDHPDAEILDAADMIVMPGFVDCHRHMWQTQLRAMTADWSLFDYSSRIRSIYSSFYDPEDAYLGCYAGFLEALNAGVTTIVDHAHIMNSPDHADETVRAFQDAKIRGILCYGLFNNPKPDDPVSFDVFNPPAWRFDDALRVRRDLLAPDDGRVRFGLALTETEWFPLELTRRELDLARELGAARISAHVGLGAMSRHTRFVERLARAGLLGPDLLCVHGWSLTDRELKHLADCGASVVTTVETELQMGMGFPALSRVLAQGGRAGIGVDIVSNQSADMFTQIRLILAVQRALENEDLARRNMMPEKIRLKARDLLEAATIGGAGAAGLDNRTGSITPGKEADIIMIRSDAVNMTPTLDPVNTVVMCANVGDVDTVLVAGEPVKRGGRLLGVDWPCISSMLRQSSEKILNQGREKGFDRAETLVNEIFPLTPQAARVSRIAALLMRVPFLQPKILQAVADRVEKLGRP